MKAFITGVTGQDGSYMAELLLEKGYEVHGLARRSSGGNTRRIEHILPRITLHVGDLTDANNLHALLRKIQPDEIYNFAAMSQVRVSYEMPAYTADVTGVGYARLLEAVRAECPEAKVYQACSSEMFGDVLETPQSETTPLNPVSPYGAAKTYTYFLGRGYRKGAYKMKIYNGILFNHESPRRGQEFLSTKVVEAAVKIKKGLQDEIKLGNLDAIRDWGYAKEYVQWIWTIMQGEPDDYVIGTGESHSVKEFIAEVFFQLGLPWEDFVTYDQTLERATEVDILQADYSKSKRVLGFEPQVKFKELIKIMVDTELAKYA